MSRQTSPFTSVSSEGGLLPPELLARIAAGDPRLPCIAPADYALPPSARLGEAAARAWAAARACWAAFRAALDYAQPGDSGVTATREQLLLPLFQILGYGRLEYRAAAERIGDRTYAISHRAGSTEGSPPIHLVGHRQGLDEPIGTSEARRISPHGLLQEYLNGTEHLWGIVGNGTALRLLHDNLRLSRPTYVEFDLQAIFEGGIYADFVLLYLLLHRSRLPHSFADVATCPLSRWAETAQRDGSRALADLRTGVKTAIERLGCGFLAHPANEALRTALREGTLGPEDYYREILRLVYRLLFLLVAEERELLFDDTATPRQRGIYDAHYAIGRLRPTADGRRAVTDRHDDLWHGLRTTFAAMRDGSDPLGLKPLGGGLFAPESSPHLDAAALANPALLDALHGLSQVRAGNVLARVNYRDMNVEELGSVYESLLDYHPLIRINGPIVSFELGGGSERKTTGSYYTPESLVQELITSALEPVIAARLAEASGLTTRGLTTTDITTTNPIPTGLTTTDLTLKGHGRDETLKGHDGGRILKDRGIDNADQTIYGQVPAMTLQGQVGGVQGQVARSQVGGMQGQAATAGGQAAPAQAARAALLTITVCDPACGSGHFLLAAARRLARELARIDSGQREPSPRDIYAATREVVRRCIYGVDLNPLAVDLCKLALWIEGHVPGTPLAFLDHRIRCGNSLVGATAKTLEAGIPNDAFAPVTGDDKGISRQIVKRNKEDQKRNPTQLTFSLGEPTDTASDEEVRQARALTALPEGDVAESDAKAARYAEFDARMAHKREIADTWAAAFFWVLKPDAPLPPTQSNLQALRQGGRHLTLFTALTEPQRERIRALVAANRIFHWHLEFPEVFGADGEGGFDCLLGNPPWERIKLQEEEYFAARDIEIATAANKAARDRLIKALLVRAEHASDKEHDRRLGLAAAFESAKHAAEAQSKFMRQSGRYPLTAVGDVNTYALFAEQFRANVGPYGRAGIIIPIGIINEDATKEFFSTLVDTRTLVSVLGFENEGKVFPAVHHAVKFCLFTFCGAPLNRDEAILTFFNRSVDQAKDVTRHCAVNPSELALLNPNTRTCPIFRSKVDATLTINVYTRIGVLENIELKTNPWGIIFHTMFHMANDSGLFRTYSELQEDGYALQGWALHLGARCYLPLYESKMIQMYDHRSADITVTDNIIRSGQSILFTLADHSDANRFPRPQYWVEMNTIEARLTTRSGIKWLVAFKDVIASTNERTAIFCILPICGVAHTAPLALFASASTREVCCFLANMNSLILDYICRQKVGGLHLTYTYLRQLPVLPPDRYTPADIDYIVPRVLELVYTAWDLQPFARDLGYDGPPFTWDDDRRSQLRAELDAYYARLYGLTRKQLRYILDPHSLTDRELTDILDPWEDHPDAPRTTTFPGETFRVLKSRELKQYGEYRTGQLVLAAWDRQAAVIAVVPAISQSAPAADPIGLHVALLCRIIAKHREHDLSATLGRVKAEKLVHLIENVCEVDLDRHPLRDAAGPVDFRHLLAVIARAKAEGAFVEHSHEGGKRYTYEPLQRFDEILEQSAELFGDKLAQIDRLITRYIGFDTDYTEIVATLYAAWNDMLAAGRNPSEADLFEAFYGWSPSKVRFQKGLLRIALADMRELKIVPTGRGRTTPPIP